MSEILIAASTLSCPVIYPCTPALLNSPETSSFVIVDSIMLVEPVGYLESIFLTKHAMHVITDSGGVQREAFFAKTPCTVPMTLLAWPEIMVDGRCVLVFPERSEIERALDRAQTVNEDYLPFGDGNAAKRIVDILAGRSKEVL